MGVANYVRGLFALTAIALLMYDVARRVRRAVMPRWTGAPARLAEAVLGVAVLVSLLQALGAVGRFELVPCLVASLVAAGITAACTRRWHVAPDAGPPDPARRDEDVVMRMVAGTATGLALATWISPFRAVLRHGIFDIDSIQYHLPFAARFVQTGSITGIHQVRPSPAPGYFPANGELLHGVGMLAFDRDPLSPLINFGWLALLLLAAWCIGRRWGAGSLTMLAAALVAATPVIASTHAGTALTDVAALSLLMAAVALLLNGESHPVAVALAALAAGVGLGTKLTIAPAVVAISIVLVLARRTRRLPVLLSWFVPLVGTGSFWLIRNFVRSGNPLPVYRLGIGRFALDAYDDEEYRRIGYSVAHYATDAHFWTHTVPSGLTQAVGSAWPALLATALAGAVLAWRGRDPWVRAIGVAGVVALLAYPVTPYTAAGADGHPTLFVYDTRYLMPALLLGLVALVLLASSRRSRIVVAFWLLVVTLVTALSDGQAGISGGRFVTASFLHRAVIVAAGGAAGLFIAWAASRTRPSLSWPGTLRIGVATATALAMAGGGWLYQRAYADARYRPLPQPATDATAWFSTVDNARIGVAGFTEQYPLYGPTLHNFVDFVGVERAHGGFGFANTCPEWRSALVEGRYDYVVLANQSIRVTDLPWEPWTVSDARAHRVLATDHLEIFRLEPPGTSADTAVGC